MLSPRRRKLSPQTKLGDKIVAESVPVFQVIDGRFFASAKDKDSLDRYLAANGESPLPVEALIERDGGRSPKQFCWHNRFESTSN